MRDRKSLVQIESIEKGASPATQPPTPSGPELFQLAVESLMRPFDADSGKVWREHTHSPTAGAGLPCGKLPYHQAEIAV